MKRDLNKISTLNKFNHKNTNFRSSILTKNNNNKNKETICIRKEKKIFLSISRRGKLPPPLLRKFHPSPSLLCPSRDFSLKIKSDCDSMTRLRMAWKPSHDLN